MGFLRGIIRTPIDRLAFAFLPYPVYGFSLCLVLLSLVLSWWFVCVLLVFLAIHEFMHARVMRRCGIQVDYVFIAGAVNGAHAVFEDESAEDWVRILLAGPVTNAVLLVVGLVASSVLTGYVAEGMAIVYVFAWIALLNALPLLASGSDGMRLVETFSVGPSRRLAMGMAFIATLASAWLANIFLEGHWVFWPVSFANVLAVAFLLWLLVRRRVGSGSTLRDRRYVRRYVASLVVTFVVLMMSGFALRELLPGGVSDLIFRDSVLKLIWS